MARKLAYWISTSIVAAMMAFAGVMYLAGAPEVVKGFAEMGYPQHLRIILGVAKLAGAVTLIAPGLSLPKEWAYAGFTLTWVVACVAHAAAGHGLQSFTPLVLLGFLVVSYVTRPASRRLTPAAAAA